MKSLVNLAIAALLAVPAGAAMADAYGSGGMGQITITLIDLDPNDGIAPSLSFAAGADFNGPHLYGYVRASTPDEDVYREFERIGQTQASGISGGSSTAWSSASGSASGMAGLGYGPMTVQGSALSGADASGVFYSLIYGSGAQFTLSAHTAVSFSVDGWAHGQTTLGGDPDTGFDEAGGALLELELGGTATDGSLTWDRQQGYAVARYTLDANGLVTGTTEDWAGRLSVSYANTADASADGIFLAKLSASGYSVAAAPVPEPQSAALLLGGLALLALGRRRARKA